MHMCCNECIINVAYMQHISIFVRELCLFAQVLVVIFTNVITNVVPAVVSIKFVFLSMHAKTSSKTKIEVVLSFGRLTCKNLV